MTLGDTQILDLITYFGNSFQPKYNSSASNTDRKSDTNNTLVSKSSDNNKDENVLIHDLDKSMLSENTIEEEKSNEEIKSESTKDQIRDIYSQSSPGLTKKIAHSDFKSCSYEDKPKECDRITGKGNEEDVDKNIRHFLQEHKNESEPGERLLRKNGEYSFSRKLSNQEQTQEKKSSKELSDQETCHVLLKIHEGTLSKSPFTISPKQVVSNCSMKCYCNIFMMC